jgi:hypothetical protein
MILRRNEVWGKLATNQFKILSLHVFQVPTSNGWKGSQYMLLALYLQNKSNLEGLAVHLINNIGVKIECVMD